MPRKYGKKSWWKNIKNNYKRSVFRICFWLIPIVFVVSLVGKIDGGVSAIGCPDVKIIFVRGSGEKRWEDQSYLAFKDALEQKLKLTELAYQFEDLDYPAVGVGDLWVLLSAFVSGGEAYDFGESVDTGVINLISAVNGATCPSTKYVVAGYSQGAMVVSKAAEFLNSERLIYTATFGDPKIYLPEGFGMMPAACRGADLSNYRIYVPDCRAYEGILGGYKPYQPEVLVDKMGTWCNKMDILCSSHFSLDNHISYVTDGLYEDASKLIFDKICKAFGIKNTYVSLHDVAILIDTTASMGDLIDNYKSEALRLTEKVINSGGRVALYDYRELASGYAPKEYCDFEDCTLTKVEESLNNISVDGGGDLDESLLSAGFHVMKKLNWKYGSTKSVVVLTDGGFHNPDIDGIGFEDVVALSKSIDPVNFYIITLGETMDEYLNLADATGGEVVNAASDLSFLTDKIVARYDALPRVEDFGVSDEIMPILSDVSWEQISDSEALVKFSSSSGRTMVILNDVILGISEDSSVVISELDFTQENIVRLVPISENIRGAGVQLELNATALGNVENVLIPKAPNAGRR